MLEQLCFPKRITDCFAFFMKKHYDGKDEVAITLGPFGNYPLPLSLPRPPSSLPTFFSPNFVHRTYLFALLPTSLLECAGVGHVSRLRSGNGAPNDSWDTLESQFCQRRIHSMIDYLPIFLTPSSSIWYLPHLSNTSLIYLTPPSSI